MNTNAQKAIGHFHSALCLLLSAAACSVQIRAATITVTSTADSGAGTLRAALASANNGDTINFALPTPSTILLTSGELVVSNSVQIVGPGANNLSVDGNAANRVFHISNSVVLLKGLSVTNGAEITGLGGGVWNERATLVVSNCVVSGNTAQSGAGLLNEKGTLTVSDSMFSQNSADGNGAGIYSVAYDPGGAASAQIIRTLVSSNLAVTGGGIRNLSYNSGIATLTILESTVVGNSAYDGGGIQNDNTADGTATLGITNSTLYGNISTIGGGIENLKGSSGTATVSIVECTLKGDSAATGSAIYN